MFNSNTKYQIEVEEYANGVVSVNVNLGYGRGNMSRGGYHFSAPRELERELVIASCRFADMVISAQANTHSME